MSEDRAETVDLDAWLAPFLTAMGRQTRRHWAPLYLRGLLGPGDRKSLQPMAERLGLSGHDQLQHFVASPAWDDAPLWTELSRQADRLLGGPDALLVIDDTALPKQGTHSIAVARQYCGALGKRANCQSLVSLTLARHEVPLPLGLRPFLPEEWISVEAVLDERPWRRVTQCQGTKGRLSARFSALRVRVADEPVFGNNRHLPGEEVWLVGEWRSSGERKYYLSNLPARITRRALVGAIKARWVCKQAHQQLKDVSRAQLICPPSSHFFANGCMNSSRHERGAPHALDQCRHP